MGTPRRVTEEDLHVTEALIADSYARLKRSIAETPSRAVSPASNIIREHPLAVTVAAAGAGVLAFQLAKMFMPAFARREKHKGKDAGIGVTGQLFSMAAPFIASVLQQQLSRAISGKRR